MPKGKTVTNAVVGTLLAILLYTVPGLNIAAPLLAGAVAAYSQREGLRGGIKVGILMAVLLIVPGVFASIVLSMIPEVGGALGLGWLLISFLLLGHSIVLTIAGGVMGGLLSERE